MIQLGSAKTNLPTTTKKMKRIIPIIAALLAPMPLLHAAEAEAPLAKPNIVFIYADDWGWGDLSCHGNTWLKTPHIDSLANEGIDFLQFNVLSPICSPSRAAALTGHYPSRYGINTVFGPRRPPEMPDWLDGKAPTIPRYLKTAGYHTGHFGKWHLGDGGPTMADYGFDESATYHGPGPKVRPDGYDIADKAVEFIDANKDKTFFLNVWLHESHLAHTPSPESLELWKDLDERKQVYAAVITDGDNKVGMILDALKRHGLTENTLVVFSSDNGPAKTKDGDKGVPGKWRGHYSIGETDGMRGQKGSLYEGGVRTPLIMRWPAKTPPGVKNDTTVLTAVDLLPTFCAAAGVTPSEDDELDGENLLEALKGKPVLRTRPLFWRITGREDDPNYWPNLAVREGDWKLVTTFDGSRVELHNLITNRDEKIDKDQSKEHPEMVAKMTKMALDWYATHPTKADPTCIDPDKDRTKKPRKKDRKKKTKE